METITFLQGFATPALDTFFQLVTRLGNTNAYIVLLLTVYLAVDSRFGQRLGILVLISYYLNFHLKGLLETARPFELNPALGRTPEARVALSGPGFPSAHAQIALTFWGYLAWWVQRPWFWGLAALVTVLVSASRMYLGLHFPVDILGGLVIGALGTTVMSVADPLWPDLKRVAKPVRLTLGFLVPLFLMLALPPPGQEPDLILGALAAFCTAPLLFPYTPPRSLWARLGIAFVAIVLVFAALSASSLLLPEAVKRNPVGGFSRYLLLSYIGLLLTPWLAQRFRRAPVRTRAAD